MIQKFLNLFSKSSHQSKTIEVLEIIAPSLPIPIYWHDRNGIVLGINDLCLKAIGASQEIIGKTPYEFYPKKTAEHILKYNDEVMRTEKVLSQEERIEDITTGNIRYFFSVKSPLYNNNDEVIGIIGASVEITAQKEAEQLKLEAEKLKFENEQHILKQLEDQKEFITLAEQVAHDIRSPVTSLLMITKACEAIPEKERIALREAASRVQDIANHLLTRYRVDKKVLVVNSESPLHSEREAMLVSAMLLEVITEKRYQYKDLPIKFDTAFTTDGYFGFIKMDVSAFKRMISNLINNAVDALEDKSGRILLILHAGQGRVGMMIDDDGKGMPPETVAKIKQNIALTEGKKEGHGIGLCQVRETLANNEGELDISSRLGKGTCITLNFKQIPAPLWIAEQITLYSQDQIIILDDDGSIHTAWDTRFNSIRQAAPELKISHFEQGSAALAFINQFSAAEKENIVLLSDYELLNQSINGLEIIKKAGISRAILVTSHYANALVRKEAEALGIKILPKEMASEINIEVQPGAKTKSEKSAPKKVDMVIVEDDDILGEVLKTYFSQTRKVVYYSSAKKFLADLPLYPKDTQISLDNNFTAEGISGLALANELHAKGYNNLYLLSGKEFAPHEIPPYLTFILKGEPNMLKRLGSK